MNCNNKERPILFSGPMVQAILDGRKTQTRRAIKLNHSGRAARAGRNWHLGDPNADKACPYGAPGDRLWVREAHCIGISGLPNGMGIVPIKSEAIKPGMKVVYKQGANYGDDPPPWRPSIHMPRWASRLTLEITEIRVQRLQEISEEDAKAEGAYPPPAGTDDDGAHFDSGTCRDGFIDLWRSINGPGSWAANPWVWCVSFKRVQP